MLQLHTKTINEKSLQLIHLPNPHSHISYHNFQFGLNSRITADAVLPQFTKANLVRHVELIITQRKKPPKKHFMRYKQATSKQNASTF